jgi:hypothetical protein
MKPISLNESNRRKTTRTFPITDCNYHAPDFDGLRCTGRPRPSFSDIGRDYFETESPRATRIETLMFAVVGLTALPALIDAARAASHLIQLIS